MAVDPRLRSTPGTQRVEVPVASNDVLHPITITAFSRTSPQDLRQISDITGFVPNLQFAASAGDASSARVYLRGIGTGDPISDGNGIDVDSVYLPRARGVVISTADVAQVEVLRGPQSTLFSKNTIGGIVNIVTERPSSAPPADPTTRATPPATGETDAPRYTPRMLDTALRHCSVLATRTLLGEIGAYEFRSDISSIRKILEAFVDALVVFDRCLSDTSLLARAASEIPDPTSEVVANPARPVRDPDDGGPPERAPGP